MENTESPITGFDLRYVLTTMLVAARGTMTVAELASAVGSRGIPVNGRPSKAISDALRSEIRKGRVVRVGLVRYHATSKIPAPRWAGSKPAPELSKPSPQPRTPRIRPH